MNLERPTQRHIIIKLSKFKDKGRILKALRKKATCYLQGTHPPCHKETGRLLKQKPCKQEECGKIYSKY